MLRSLYGKLALALLGLLGLVAVMYAVVGVSATDLYLQEVRQKLHRTLAADLIKEGLLLQDGSVDPQGLEHVIHMLMVINPSIEVYVLDAQGRVLTYSTPPGKLHRERVALEPITRYLEGDSPFPIRGDDPRDPVGRKVFSAATIGDPGHPDGYVYVVLGGQLHDTAAQRLSGSYVLRMGAAALAGGLLFTLVAGLLLFGVTTRRLRRLASDVAAFRAGEPPAPISTSSRRAERRGDGIDLLRATFQRMAGRLGEQLTDLEQADRMRRELVANVSHDLRTPLASLHGYLETLLLKGDQLDPAERRRYLEIATRHSRRLGRRVAELFELARLDASAARPRPERFSLAELVQDVIQKFQIEAGHKQVRLHTERERNLPFVDADIGMIERVLENLLGNAVRHTPAEGQVTVSVDGMGPDVRVHVRDTGPGIPPDQLTSVFERFYRCREDGPGGDAGTGLGLAIARKIVELHHGSIRVSSRVGDGSVFTFTLPAATAVPPSPVSPP